METLTETLDLQEEADELRERVESLEEEIDQKVERALELDPPQDADELAERDQIEEDVDQLQQDKQYAESYLGVLERALDDWDGSEVVLRELTGAEARSLSAQAQKRAQQAGVDYDESFHEALLLEKAVEQTPPGAPDPEQIGDLPNRLFDWLLTRANMLNSFGEFELGNSSLQERMAEKRNSRQEV